MNKRAITSSFKNYLKDRRVKEKDITLESLMDLVLAYFQEVQFESADIENDGDMMLFEYGTYDWGQGKFFQIGLTRQLIEMHEDDEEQEDHMYQLRVTLFYNPTEFETVGDFNKWSSTCSSLNDFKDVIINSAGYQAALNRNPVRLEIITDAV